MDLNGGFQMASVGILHCQRTLSGANVPVLLDRTPTDSSLRDLLRYAVAFSRKRETQPQQVRSKLWQAHISGSFTDLAH
jgi:hypothetical protein